MATEVASLYARISGDTTGLTRALGDARSQVTGFGAGMAKSLGVAALVGGAGLAATGAMLVNFGKDAVMAASKANESMSKMEVVFGGAAGDIRAFAESAATDLGMSEQQAIEASGTFGNLFTSMGLGRQPAADLSVGIVKLAADLGSFNNLSTDVMLEKMRAGLVGEVEPLRAVGINLSAAAVNAKALEMGLASANGAVSQAALLQARYALMVEQSANAQGDFARTSDGLANSLKIAGAETANLKEELGKLVIGPYTAVVHVVTRKVSDLNQMINPNKAALATSVSDTYLTSAQNALKLAEEGYRAAAEQGAYLGATTKEWAIEVSKAEAAVASAKNATLAATAVANGWGTAGVTAAVAIAKAAATVADVKMSQWANDVDAVDKALTNLRGKEEALKVQSVAAAILAGTLNEAQVAALGLAAAYDLLGKKPTPYGLDSAMMTYKPPTQKTPSASAWQGGGSNNFYKPMFDAQIAQQKADGEAAAARRTNNLQINQQVADDYATQMKSAAEEWTSYLKGELSGAVQDSLQLGAINPNAGKPNAPGANGAFEDLFRIQDIALNANKPGKDTGKWMEMYGMGQDEAKKITEKFQAGLFDKDVMKYVNKEKLKEQFKMKELAEASQQALMDELGIASKGKGGQMFKSMMGFGTDAATGNETAPDAKPVVDGMLGSLKAELTSQADRVGALGSQLYGGIRDKMLDDASNDTAFLGMVERMVASAIAKSVKQPPSGGNAK